MTKYTKKTVIVLPGYTTEAEMDSEIFELTSSNKVYTNRSAWFPSPVTYNVNCETISATKLFDAEVRINMPNTHSIVLTISVAGLDGEMDRQIRNVNEWITNTYNKIKMII